MERVAAGLGGIQAVPKPVSLGALDHPFRDPDVAYAEWYAWSLREVSPDSMVSFAAAQAAIMAQDEGKDRAAQELAARKSPQGLGITLLPLVNARRRAYAQWYAWARREIGGDPPHAHAAAGAAVRRLEAGASSYEAAAAARQAAGVGDRPPPAPEPDEARTRPDVDPFDAVIGPLPDPPARPGLMYGGFWRRLLAYLIDSLLLLVPTFATLLLIFYAPGAADIPAVTTFWVLFLLLVGWAYCAGLESSSLEGTLGKAAVGVVVTDLEGRRISFGRATARYWSRVLLSSIFAIGYLLAAFSEQKRALHDLIAGTLVVSREYVPLIAHMAGPPRVGPPLAPPPVVAPPMMPPRHPEPVGGQARQEP